MTLSLPRPYIPKIVESNSVTLAIDGLESRPESVIDPIAVRKGVSPDLKMQSPLEQTRKGMILATSTTRGPMTETTRNVYRCSAPGTGRSNIWHPETVNYCDHISDFCFQRHAAHQRSWP
jgi:hypothetical protein